MLGRVLSSEHVHVHSEKARKLKKSGRSRAERIMGKISAFVFSKRSVLFFRATM